MGVRQWAGQLFGSAKEKKSPAFNMRKFQAARIDRTTAAWFATTSSINQELKGDLNLLRARGRELVKNNEHASKYASMCMNNVIGPNGFTLQARVSENGEQDRFANDAIEAAFYRWSEKGICDITGRLSFCDFTRSIISGMPSDGEFLVRKVYGRGAQNDFGFALQMIDVDRLDTNYNENASGNKNAVIMGVEVNSYRRPVAYHIFTAHPSEYGRTTRERERVPAENIIHGFIQEMPEQMRGIPWMSSSMLSLHHLDEFEKSALLAARKGANTLGFFVSPEGTLNPSETDDGSDAQIQISVPGEYDTLPDGYDFRPYDSKYPDAMMADFCKLYQRRIANGFKVSHASLANDLTEVNFSSIRTGVIEERDQWMVRQSWFVNAFLTEIYREWIKFALLKGQIALPNGSALPAAKLDKFIAHQWQGRRWSWVDPLKDIQSAREAVKSGVASPQMIAAQNGVDIEDVIKDIQKFEDLILKAKIQSVSYLDAPQPNGKISEPTNQDGTV
jgi:lambda family phage portal protein